MKTPNYDFVNREAARSTGGHNERGPVTGTRSLIRAVEQFRSNTFISALPRHQGS